MDDEFVEDVVCGDAQPVDVHVTDTSGSDSSSDSDAVDEALDDVKRARLPTAVGPASATSYVGADFFVHRLWCTLHRAHPTDVSRLACGRHKHAGFNKHDPKSGVIRAECAVCFAKPGPAKPDAQNSDHEDP